MISYHPGWAVPCNAIPEATRTTSESLEPPGMAFLWQISKENTFHTENTWTNHYHIIKQWINMADVSSVFPSSFDAWYNWYTSPYLINALKWWVESWTPTNWSFYEYISMYIEYYIVFEYVLIWKTAYMLYTNVWAMSTTTTDGNLRSSGTFQLETWMNLDLGSIEPQYQSPNPSETIMV
jgi:hypothetical protein